MDSQRIMDRRQFFGVAAAAVGAAGVAALAGCSGSRAAAREQPARKRAVRVRKTNK